MRQDQAEMMVDEVRQLLRLYQPPSYASPTVPTIDELVALTKAFDEAGGRVRKEDRRASC